MRILYIQPQIVGELFLRDAFGNFTIPENIRFSTGTREGECEGDAYATVKSDIYGENEFPVFKGGGERLSIPGYAGLSCRFDAVHGILCDFCEQ